MSTEVYDRAAALAGVEYRHPYYDRRLVEFGCRTPIMTHASPTLNRCLQRGALRDVLPASIATRRSKARFSDVWMREFDNHITELANTRVARAGWLDLAEAQASIRKTREALSRPQGGGSIYFLWGLVQAEAVLRALEDH